MRNAEYRYAGCAINIEQAQFKNVEVAEDGTSTETVVDGYVLIVKDPHEPAVHIFPFADEVKEAMLKALTGGLVVAPAGALPRMAIPRG